MSLVKASRRADYSSKLSRFYILNASPRFRYRKFNLVGESAFNKTEAPEVAIFTTNFGVTFGLITGHDLLFSSPAFELINDQNVTNFVHPTAWVNTMPFLTGKIYKYIKQNYSIHFGVGSGVLTVFCINLVKKS